MIKELFYILDFNLKQLSCSVKRSISLNFFFILFICFIPNLKAQEVSATLDTTKYLIGDWIPLTLTAIVSKDATVDWPLIDANIEELEVLQRTGIDSNITNENKTYTQTLTLTVFDSGYYPIPAFDFIIDEDTLSTEAQIILITSVELDTANLDVKEIKPPLQAPLTFMDVFWPFGALILLAMLLIGGLIYYFTRKKEGNVEIKVAEIVIPAHEWAFSELSKLKEESLWQQGDIKQYYSKITYILRQYIELRYKQPALESTSDEIINRLKLLKLDQHLLENVQIGLTLSDFVKFAKAKPLADQHEQSFQTVYEFVDATKIIETKTDTEL